MDTTGYRTGRYAFGTQKKTLMPDQESQKKLRDLQETVFNGDLARTALALGRTEDEVAAMLSGEEAIDEDLEMKINGLAEERRASA